MARANQREASPESERKSQTAFPWRPVMAGRPPTFGLMPRRSMSSRQLLNSGLVNRGAVFRLFGIPKKTGSHETRRWREMDSNFRFRAGGDTPHRPRVKPQATAAGCHFGEILPQGATLMMALSVSFSRNWRER
jgi:hypothetical protein